MKDKLLIIKYPPGLDSAPSRDVSVAISEATTGSYVAIVKIHELFFIYVVSYVVIRISNNYTTVNTYFGTLKLYFINK